MNISLKFLQRYVDLPADLTYEQIAYDLTMRTVEVESIINTADKFHDIVVGEIKEIKPHPNADALRICPFFRDTDFLVFFSGKVSA